MERGDDWLYVEDHCKAIDLILRKPTVGEVDNIGGHNEMKNIDIVNSSVTYLGKLGGRIKYTRTGSQGTRTLALRPI